ncbi:hypothetical protein Tco_1502372 [Tanacetum coccineum]
MTTNLHSYHHHHIIVSSSSSPSHVPSSTPRSKPQPPRGCDVVSYMHKEHMHFGPRMTVILTGATKLRLHNISSFDGYKLTPESNTFIKGKQDQFGTTSKSGTIVISQETLGMLDLEYHRLSTFTISTDERASRGGSQGLFLSLTVDALEKDDVLRLDLRILFPLWNHLFVAKAKRMKLSYGTEGLGHVNSKISTRVQESTYGMSFVPRKESREYIALPESTANGFVAERQDLGILLKLLVLIGTYDCKRTRSFNLSSAEQALHDELVSLMHQESLAKLHNDDQTKDCFLKRKRGEYWQYPTDSDDDIQQMCFLYKSFDAEEGGVADYNNLDPTIDVPSTPTLRIHKIHPQSQIIGKTNRTNHKVSKTCLFDCFSILRRNPKEVSQALADESWVEAMQEELLQFKLQEMRFMFKQLQVLKIPAHPKQGLQSLCQGHLCAGIKPHQEHAGQEDLISEATIRVTYLVMKMELIAFLSKLFGLGAQSIATRVICTTHFPLNRYLGPQWDSTWSCITSCLCPIRALHGNIWDNIASAPCRFVQFVFEQAVEGGDRLSLYTHLFLFLQVATSMQGIIKALQTSSAAHSQRAAHFSKCCSFTRNASVQGKLGDSKKQTFLKLNKYFKAQSQELRKCPNSSSHVVKYHALWLENQNLKKQKRRSKRHKTKVSSVKLGRNQDKGILSEEHKRTGFGYNSSTARQGTITPKDPNFEEEAGPSRPTSPRGLKAFWFPYKLTQQPTQALETTNDEEAARKIQAEWDAEEERKRKEKQKDFTGKRKATISEEQPSKKPKLRTETIDELRNYLRVVDFEKSVHDKESLEGISMITELHPPPPPPPPKVIVSDGDDVMTVWKDQEEWEIIVEVSCNLRWSAYARVKDGTMIHNAG